MNQTYDTGDHNKYKTDCRHCGRQKSQRKELRYKDKDRSVYQTGPFDSQK